MSDRKIGCLLSGGLDSSLIAALVAKYGDNSKLDTFQLECHWWKYRFALC